MEVIVGIIVVAVVVGGVVGFDRERRAGAAARGRGEHRRCPRDAGTRPGRQDRLRVRLRDDVAEQGAVSGHRPGRAVAGVVRDLVSEPGAAGRTRRSRPSGRRRGRREPRSGPLKRSGSGRSSIKRWRRRTSGRCGSGRRWRAAAGERPEAGHGRSVPALRRLAPAAAVLTLAAPAGACPLCTTQTAAEIRAELVDEHLGVSVAAVAAPLGALGLTLAGVARWPGRIRGPGAV